MKSIGTIIKEIIIPHRKGNIRLKAEFSVLEDAHIQGFFLGTYYQRVYGIGSYNSKNRYITKGTNKEKKFPLDIYHMSNQDPLEEFIIEWKKANSVLPSPITGHDIKLYLNVERPSSPIFRRPPYPASPETRKEIERNINELLDMDFIRKIGHNEIVEITTPALINWHNGKYQFCGDFRALNSYKKSEKQLNDSEARYGATQTECLNSVWDPEKLHYEFDGAVFKVYTAFTALKSFLNMKTTNRDMLRWQIAIHEYRGIMNIIYKEGKTHTNAEGLSRWPLDNFKRNQDYDPEVSAKIPIYFMEIDRRRNFKFSKWVQESGSSDSYNTEPEGTETPIVRFVYETLDNSSKINSNMTVLNRSI
ncbi:hypothetical protein O181_065638 [Austropuccinia psidii MF-1]|uniref:Reverse transcriptase RNase H-like domain-containing protein n=1 Tax=Austropuccinia psidii MF-1 TaxID=1389203 RepID=A0A9Q3I2T4_9BASI|nr:hypothetical protein [Austropuccinia psidii MF-1]